MFLSSQRERERREREEGEEREGAKEKGEREQIINRHELSTTIPLCLLLF